MTVLQTTAKSRLHPRREGTVGAASAPRAQAGRIAAPCEIPEPLRLKGGEVGAGGRRPTKRPLALPKKHELVVWLRLGSEQRVIYRQHLEDFHVNAPEASEGHGQAGTRPTRRCPLAMLQRLGAICDHPALLNDRREWDQLVVPARAVDAAAPEPTPYVRVGAAGRSSKLVFLSQLLRRLHSGGHRVLIFSRSVKMLDLVERGVVAPQYSHLRVDGTNVADLEERSRLFRRFNRDSGVFCMLITARGRGARGG